MSNLLSVMKFRVYLYKHKETLWNDKVFIKHVPDGVFNGRFPSSVNGSLWTNNAEIMYH